MGRATSEGNEVKSKMKQDSDMPATRFEHGWWWRSVVQHATVRPRRRPECCVRDASVTRVKILLVAWPGRQLELT